MNWRKFLSHACLIFASAFASAMIYNELFLKPWAKHIEQGGTTLFMYYPTIIPYVIVVFILIIMAIILEQR